ncbi:MAG: YebC/PmpR family DNA-binding transcriptional regulator [Deltaproteobacteria bacterium]|nr:YebC/PmpR family DNA-binding transcriptional regulator [Deltaproteobacteria bacterium]
MSGHSKWATIKRKKGAADAKRGATFTKLIKAITVAAKMGGGDISGNPRLRKAVDDAKAQSMPVDNINRAIKKGTGELEGVNYEDNIYEAYGPNGVAIMIDTTTDNKNRTVSELRHTLSRNGGNLGESGSVAWVFHKKGQFILEKTSSLTEDKLMEIALDAGAEDIKDEDEQFEVTCDPASFDAVKAALDKAGLKCSSSDVALIPQNHVELSTKEEAEKMLKLMDILEEHDDVNKVYANFDIPEKLMEQME